MRVNYWTLCLGAFVLLSASAFAQGPAPLIFPQFANGAFEGGSLRSTLVLQNTGPGAVTARAEFFRDDGSPYILTFTDGQTGAARDIPIGPGASVFLTTNGQGPLASGWVNVSNAAVGGTVIFSQYDGSGRLVTEASVGASTPGTAFTIPLDTTNPYNTGVAFVNPGVGAVGGMLRLLNNTGGEVAARDFPALSALNHSARFVPDLFPGAGVGLQGSLVVTTSGPVAAVGLRTSSNVLTTLPILPGAATGGPAAPAITGLSTTSGPPGSVLTINGARFSGTSSANTVRFGAAVGTVRNATPTALTVVAPAQPPGRYPVSVTVAGQTSNALDFQITGSTPFTLGAYRGTTSQSNLDIFLGAVDVQGTISLYMTRTQYQAQCSRGAFVISVSGPGGSDGPVGIDGRFSLTNLDGDLVRGQFDSATHISGTINFAPFQEPDVGTCPAVTVSFNADYRPNAPAITQIRARGSTMDMTVSYSGTQPIGSAVSRVNLNLIDRNFRPIQGVEDQDRRYDIPLPTPFSSSTFDGAISLSLEGARPEVVGVQLLLQNVNGSTLVELSAPANALFNDGS